MRKRQKEAPAPAFSAYDRAAAAVLGIGIVVIPVVFTAGAIDTFRVPKEVVFRAEAIVLLVIAVFAATAARGSWRDLVRGISRVELLLCAAVLAWTGLTTITSTNRLLSIDSLLTVVASLVLYLATRRVAPDLPLTALDVCLLPGLVNAILIALQEYGVWNPFVFPPSVTGHPRSTALLGHPNDAGVYLLGTSVAAIVAATTVRGRRRWVYVVVALILFGGLVASATRTALIAFLATMLVLALRRPWKQSLVAFIALTTVVAATLTASSTVREHFLALVDAARQERYDLLFSERVMPFLAAVDMTRGRPLTGVGPGCFRYHYMDERLALSKRFPQKWTRSWPQNFGETHNDHLQTAAETGLPGYALFLAALLLVGGVSLRRPPAAQRPEAAFARAFRIPLVTAFFVVALAQFPLQIAAPRLMFLTFAALVRGWDSADA